MGRLLNFPKLRYLLFCFTKCWFKAVCTSEWNSHHDAFSSEANLTMLWQQFGVKMAVHTTVAVSVTTLDV